MVFIDLNVNFFDQENVMSFIVVIRHKSCRFTAWVIKLALRLKLYILVRSAIKNWLSLEQNSVENQEFQRRNLKYFLVRICS